MPEAHSILWCLGVFVGLWGVTLIMRGIPSGALHLLLQRPATGRSRRAARAGDWRLLAGGFVSILAGCGALLAGYTVYEWLHGPMGDLDPPVWMSVALGTAAFSICLLVWAVHGKRTLSPCCPKCLYDMAGSGSTCPECGFEGKQSADFLRPRRRWRIAAVAFVLLVLSPALLMVPRYREYGAMGLLPSWVLIEAFEWLPESWVFTQGADDGSLQARYWHDDFSERQNRRIDRRASRLVVSSRSSDVHAAKAMRLTGGVIVSMAPEATVKRLVELVISPSDDVRAQFDDWAYSPWVIRHAHERPAIIEAREEELAARLKDPSTHIAMSAAALLLLAPDRADDAMETLVTRAGASRGGLFHASWVMVNSGTTPEARRRLISLLRDPRPGAQSLATGALYRVSLSPEDVAAILALLDDPDISIAARAVEILVFQNKEGWLLAVLEAASRRGPVEASALVAAALNDPAGLSRRSSELIAALRSGEASIRRMALDLIESLIGLEHDVGSLLDALGEIAEKDPDPVLRRHAAELLANLQGEAAPDEPGARSP